MSDLKNRLAKVSEQLRGFQGATDDSLETTPSILRNMATFVEDDLDGLISEIEDIAWEVEKLENEK